MPASAALPDSGPLAQEVRAGLVRPGQKVLPCKYLYDEVGTLLFEAISALPEYGLTAAGQRLIRAHAGEIVGAFREPLLIAELGSGNARKTRWILQAQCRRAPTVYFPIEISPAALARSRRELAGLAGLEITPLAHEYLQGLAALDHQRVHPRLRGRPLLLLFLGSSLGNFDPSEAAEFLRAVRQHLHPGDGLLLGLDLMKPAARLRLAYDDPAGVTAAFNKNLLARLNRELGTDFDLAWWQHRVVIRSAERRVEMHLRSRRAQQVHLASGETIAFRRGETIWTESSHKFLRPEVGPMLHQAGLALERMWEDTEWGFVEALGRVGGQSW
jgi:dimethylhistidine N-methyltransferase